MAGDTDGDLACWAGLTDCYKVALKTGRDDRGGQNRNG